jgi:hypothetical protein
VVISKLSSTQKRRWRTHTFGIAVIARFLANLASRASAVLDIWVDVENARKSGESADAAMFHRLLFGISRGRGLSDRREGAVIFGGLLRGLVCRRD